MNHFSITGILTTLAAAILIGTLPLIADEKSSGNLPEVMDQMRKTARQLVTEREQAYREGVCPIDSLIQAQRTLRKVELKLATEPAERRKILSTMLKEAKNTEVLAKARVEQGLATNAEFLEARLARLEAEVTLLKDKD